MAALASSPTVAMANQLSGDCAKLPELPVTEGLSDGLQVVIQLLGSAAQISGEWVGMNIMVAAQACGVPGFGNTPMTHPTAWFALNVGSNPIANAFLEAERAGYCDIKDGLGWPTQQLADYILN